MPWRHRPTFRDGGTQAYLQKVDTLSPHQVMYAGHNRTYQRLLHPAPIVLPGAPL